MNIPFHTKLLIANRGEIAIRVAQAAADLGIPTVSVYAEDDVTSLHIKKTEESFALNGRGAKAYLYGHQIIELAQASNCNLIHPGYGFLSENPHFAKDCEEVGIQFIGPKPATLSLFGNKTQARLFAQKLDIPIIPGQAVATIEEAHTFFNNLQKGEIALLKAVSGGGGRGMRLIREASQIETAFLEGQSEAKKSFGNADLYIEKYITKARHIEVQILGDGTGEVLHLGERECSLQRRYQKIIEIAPCPDLSPVLREKLLQSSIKMAKEVKYQSAITFEFLVEGTEADALFYFIEANPRLQVEHTISEEITGFDIVQFQILQALDNTFEALGFAQEKISFHGTAMQARLNLEIINEQGTIIPQVGTLQALQLPSGKDIRVDTFAYTGYTNSPNFDSLLAKIIVHSPFSDFERLKNKMSRTLREVYLQGVSSNLGLLQNLLQYKDFKPQNFHTKFLDEHLSQLLQEQQLTEPLFFEQKGSLQDTIELQNNAIEIPRGSEIIKASLPGNILQILMETNATFKKGEGLLVIESMKMESHISAEESGIIKEWLIKTNDIVAQGQALAIIEKTNQSTEETDNNKSINLEEIRPDLQALIDRKSFLYDENRPEAVARRHQKKQRTARENIEDLCDPNSFLEYGSLILAAQRTRRSIDDLIKNTPADGLVAGLGNINSQYFGKEKAQCMVLSYDYTVLAGTQGIFNHKKTDRIFELAERWQIPIVFFVEGGGGRPGDVDIMPLTVGSLDIMTFSQFAKMSGLIPRVTIVSGYCFAGNAALAGSADVIIATENISLGMGGPPMIEGGGLGIFHPKEVGPAEVQSKNGVIDILVKDEVAAVAATQKYLSYFQGKLPNWENEDERLLRHLIPENRRRVYDIRKVIHTLCDKDSVLELRQDFGLSIITAFVRIEGNPIGLLANNPAHLGGAINSDAADKAARFMQLCDAFGIPILCLCDTPGIMVGPEAEKTGTVRHAARMFTAAASLRVPYFTVVLRKGYGLGAQAMAGGSFHIPFFTVAWPTGEFGAMGLEGAIRLGFKKELESIKDPEQQKIRYEELVAEAYQQGKGMNMAAVLEIDEVIDPADTRNWVVKGLQSIPTHTYKSADQKRRFIDNW